MSEQIAPERTCPYLGLADDHDSHFSYPETAHLCFATRKESSIPLEHQASFCFSSKYQICSRFVEPFSEPTSLHTTPLSSKSNRKQFSRWQTILLSLVGLLVGLLIVFTLSYYYHDGHFSRPQNNSANVAISANPTATLTATTTPTPTATATPQEPTPVQAAFLSISTSTATPDPGVEIYTLSPDDHSIGWVTSGEERGNHFGDSFLYAGMFEGQIYSSAFQFDLSRIPRGVPIYKASVQLSGLQDDRLSSELNDQSGAEGVWALRLLAPEIDENWQRHTYQDIFNAPVLQILNPLVGEEDLAVGQTNIFELSPDQIKIVEDRIIDDEKPKISFRLDGPLAGPDNLFAWDTGYGPKSQGNKVTLLLEAGPPPATPPPFDYIVVTSTPAPENVVTAAAIVLQVTADAIEFGTATPVPPNWVTATPIPDYLIITPTPTAENAATAYALAQLATAEILTTGTPLPFPTNAVTATPTPTQTPPPPYVLITSTPTPESIYLAATMSAQITALAQQNGQATPLPENWVTPIVVTATPTPANAATAQAISELATAIALTTGTPTPTPSNMVTATPTPVFEMIPLLLSPTPTETLTPTPQAIPPVLLGKILFRSDREQSDDPEKQTDHVYFFDPATGELGRLTNSWPYNVALARSAWSSDLRFRVFTKDAIRYKNVDSSNGETVGVRDDTPALYSYDYLYKVEKQLTHFGIGIAYGGVWSPTSNQIVFVSNDSGDDEIWVINNDDGNSLQLTASNEAYNAQEIGKDTFVPELNKYPTWSPDGTQIVFASNRTKNFQLWIMNADGSDQRLLMGWDNWTPYNDWGPVWVNYLDPAPPPESGQ